MNYTVIGAGMMGRAAAFDLAKSDPGNEVLLADIDLDRASLVAREIGPNVTPVRLDVHNHAEVVSTLAGSKAAVSAVSYTVNYAISEAALEARCHVVDLGGNNDVVDRQMALDPKARDRGITIVPNSGLAPGLTNVLVAEGVQEFDTLESIRIRVGGLPQHPKPPLNYQIVFAVEGLINEYIEKALVVRNGETLYVDSMIDIEEIVFPEPLGALEAFNTSGGLSTLPKVLGNRVREMDYKTIRYKGHCEKFKMLLDLGFASNEPFVVGGSVRTQRELFEEILRRKLDYGDTDVVVARISISGTGNGRKKDLSFEFIDYYDEKNGMTAMMRTTAFPTSIIAQMLARGVIQKKGVLPPESCVPGAIMIEELKKRNLKIVKQTS